MPDRSHHHFTYHKRSKVSIYGCLCCKTCWNHTRFFVPRWDKGSEKHKNVGICLKLRSRETTSMCFAIVYFEAKQSPVFFEPDMFFFAGVVGVTLMCNLKKRIWITKVKFLFFILIFGMSDNLTAILLLKHVYSITQKLHSLHATRFSRDASEDTSKRAYIKTNTVYWFLWPSVTQYKPLI